MVQLPKPNFNDDVMWPKWRFCGNVVVGNRSILAGGKYVISNSLGAIADISGMFWDEPLDVKWEYVAVLVNPENFNCDILTYRARLDSP